MPFKENIDNQRDIDKIPIFLHSQFTLCVTWMAIKIYQVLHFFLHLKAIVIWNKLQPIHQHMICQLIQMHLFQDLEHWVLCM